MRQTVDSEFLELVLVGLNKPIKTQSSSAFTRLYAQVARTGWMYRTDIEDLFLALDPRLFTYGTINIERWLTLSGLRWTSVSSRPRARSTGVVCLDALSAAEIAELLILLERCGFNTNPKPLADLLLPEISSKPILTSAELSVFWFTRNRHKNAPLSLGVDESWIGTRPIKFIKLSTGYKVEVWGKDVTTITRLIITPSKYRRRQEPVETTCADCLSKYFKGDSESTALHRQEHKKRMAYFDPQPHPKILAELSTGSDANHVTTHSPAWKHREMYVRALAFKRELHYDFTQWGSPKGDSDPKANGILFINDAGAIVGACAFRWREDPDRSPCWGLQWIWICPKHRRQGHLEKYWPTLRKRFGDFAIEAPVSDSMRAFAIKHGDSKLLE